jgi:hypothetical protein
MAEDKPERLQFKTYLKLIENSVGTAMFRNWYVESPEQGEFDAMVDGEDSCAFYVSGVLKIFSKVTDIHGTITSTVKDLEESGWQVVKDPNPGDVLVWEPQNFSGRAQSHIGFYIGNSKAVSTSFKEKSVVEHDLNFGGQNRKIEQAYRLNSWKSDNT